MADVRAMDADLVRAPGMKIDIEQRISRQPLDDMQHARRGPPVLTTAIRVRCMRIAGNRCVNRQITREMP